MERVSLGDVPAAPGVTLMRPADLEPHLLTAD